MENKNLVCEESAVCKARRRCDFGGEEHRTLRRLQIEMAERLMRNKDDGPSREVVRIG
jgi:hypothetical protein